MKILLEILQLQKDNSYNDKMVLVVNHNLTEEFETYEKALEKLNELKNTHNNMRILEYHNDEPDNIRKPCKVLQVSD